MPELHRDGWPSYYILVGHTPVAVDLMTWAERFKGIENRVVAKTEINAHCDVSTVFLGLDHSFGQGDPVLFETMIFGGPLDRERDRYTSWADAERGHEEAVVRARKAIAQVGRIKASALSSAAGTRDDDGAKGGDETRDRGAGG